MLESLTRYWWVVVSRGVIALIFGIFALVWPHITVLALVILFGAYALVDGIMALVAAARGIRRGRPASRGWLVVEGIAGVVIGIITFVWPAETALVLLWLIAAWAIVTGILEIMAAIRLRRVIEGEWLLALGGLLSVVFGVVIAVWPGAGALAVIFVIGAYAVIFGALLIGLGLRLRRAGQAGLVRPA
jgi:uncharacterized membrane protein HdeD (DUF308 family)